MLLDYQNVIGQVDATMALVIPWLALETSPWL